MTRLRKRLAFKLIVRPMLVASCFALVACTGMSGQMQCDTQCQAQANYKKGTAYYDRGADGRAIRYFDEAIRLDPNYANAHNARAWILYTAGRNEEALPSAERAVVLAPNNAQNLSTKGHVLAALGDWVDALDVLEQSMLVGDSGWVRKYQQALAEHGYYEASIDGDYNAATKTALENCLKAACRVIQ
jgi:Tfp pilus assembly protein PilF